jgi:hypothetical protein
MQNLTFEFIQSKYPQAVSFENQPKILMENQQPLIDELAQRGVLFLDVWSSLVNPSSEMAKKLPEVIDLLTAAVDDPHYHPRVVSGIVRTLENKTIVEAIDLYDFLYERARIAAKSEALSNPQCRGLDESFFSALSAHFKLDRLQDHLQLLLDENLGERRVMLLLAFEANTKNEQIREILKSLREHPILGKAAATICKKKKLV